MQECSRFIIGLRDAGWSDTQINDFILYIETGDNQYKPKDTPTSHYLQQIDKMGRI